LEGLEYLIHITLHKDNGERLDAHMGFKAGSGSPASTGSMLMYLLIALAGLYVLYLSNEGFKKKVDSMIGNATKLK
jgi:hypothetical protein